MLSDLDVERIADRIIEALGDQLAQASEVLDSRGAAKLLRCSVSTIERRTYDGSIPSFKLKRRRLYRRAELLALKTKGGPDA